MRSDALQHLDTQRPKMVAGHWNSNPKVSFQIIPKWKMSTFSPSEEGSLSVLLGRKKTSLFFQKHGVGWGWGWLMFELGMNV